MSYEDEESNYVHAIVSLDGVPNPIHCWAAFVVLPQGVYLGNVQMEFPGPLLGPQDPETGIRPHLRRPITMEDEKTLRAALEAELREFLKDEKCDSQTTSNPTSQ